MVVVGVVSFVVQVLGLYLSAGISLWRLIQQDHGNTDGGANLKPLALNVLYSLVVAQGVVYGYRTIYDLVTRTRLVEGVVNYYSLEKNLVSEYLDQTVAGCVKDPSFGRGRNLITYAVDLLMESKYISGVLILGKIHGPAQRGLLKQQVTGSASFSHVVQRLVEIFGQTSPYGMEIRARAAGIMAAIAGSIHLDHFPAEGRMRMIQCISSLLDTFDEIPTPMATDSKTQCYKGLVVQGLSILQGLAVNEDNCRVISNTQGLLSKAMAPLISDQQLHGGNDHDEWCSMAEESLQLMKRLMAATPPGETETKLRNEISGNTQSIIRAVNGILECLRCQVLLKRQAVEVLLDLSVDTHTPIMLMPGKSGSRMFLWILLHISLVPDHHFARTRMMCGGSTHLAKKSSCVARLAGEKLQALLSSQSSTLRSVGDVVDSLARTVAAGAEFDACRIHAATILKHLCRYYTKDDEILKELKKALANVMEEVLKEIVDWLSAGEVQSGAEENNGSKVLLDLEQGGIPQDNDKGQQKGEQNQLQEELADLCWEIYWVWIDEDDPELTRQYNEIAAKMMPHKKRKPSFDITFESLVEEAQAKLREEKASRVAASCTCQLISKSGTET